MSVAAIQARLRALGDPAAAAGAARLFKTGPGQYGKGDVFLGVGAADLRATAKQFRDLPPANAVALLQSPIHEDRSVALLILVRHAEHGEDATRKQVYDLYLANTHRVNNWDLVDVSAAP